jgi:hypothetical protein
MERNNGGKAVQPPLRHHQQPPPPSPAAAMTRSSSSGSNLSGGGVNRFGLTQTGQMDRSQSQHGSDPDFQKCFHPALSAKTAKHGVEAVKRMIANLTYVEMSVVKATAPTDGPPKRKHTRRLVEESWRSPRRGPWTS